MAGKDTKAALLLALEPKGAMGPKDSDADSEGDADSEDLSAALRDKDGAALKAVIRRIVSSCMAEDEE